jgi:hypothetical protein
MIGAIPLLHLCWTFEDRRQFAPVFNVMPGLIWRASIALILCAPIYVYAVLTIRNGSNVSEFGYLFDEVYENRGRLSRAIDALQAAYGWLGLSPVKAVVGVIAGIGFAAANLATLHDRRYRWILLCINIPFSCLWALYFSYDRRNLALSIPLWALTSAVGLRILLEKYLKISPRLFGDRDSRPSRAADQIIAESLVGRYGAAAVVVAASLALVLSANSSFTDDRLLARQNQIELQILAEADSAPLASMLSLTKDLGAPVQILSEWRWGCAFHFNRTSGRCVRITSDDLFGTRLGLLARSADASVLLILLNSSINGDRERTLSESGFIEIRATEDTGFRYFVRDRRG